jgi:uncharacterized protein YfaA (DUF2138 family)
VGEVRALSAIAKSKYGIREAQLGEDECDTCDVKREVILPVNEQRDRSDRRWRRKQVSCKYVDRRKDQQSQKKCQQKSWGGGATGLLRIIIVARQR